MSPLQQTAIGSHQRGIMRNCSRRNDAIRRVAVELFEFGGKNCDLPGERQLADAGCQQFGPQLASRFDGT